MGRYKGMGGERGSVQREGGMGREVNPLPPSLYSILVALACTFCTVPLATFEKALVGNLSSAKDYLQLWTAYCDFFRRRVAKENPQEAELVELRRTFKRARDYMEACE